MAIQSKQKFEKYDVVVVGGGMAGICAAVASARKGAKTALIQDRPVLGGNASSEIRMHICGASVNMTKENMEETGILLEIMLENKRVNDSFNYSLWDAVLLHFVRKQPNLTTYLNTAMYDAHISDNTITKIVCYQLTTEITWIFEAKIFIDCTGNGTLGYMVGAEFRTGSEPKYEFNEPHAPDEPNQNRMGNTILFKAVDKGHPVKFKTPEWAIHLTEEQLKYRKHGNVSSLYEITDNGTSVVRSTDKENHDNKSFDAYCIDYGYWWIELSGKQPDNIAEYEEIRDNLVGYVYGVWDHIKNGGNHGADNYELSWVGMLPGVRESRRLIGDYILNENDILENRIFHDAVAYGGWPIDMHTPNGLLDFHLLPTYVYNFPGVYTIPYRCYYSRNINNLFMAGRNISASRLAMSSSRVMGTCSVGGQAVGTAAAMCIKYSCLPRDIGKRIEELQQELIKDDCYIPGYKNNDSMDVARTATIHASSQLPGRECHYLVNGLTRSDKNNYNYWESNGIAPNGETVSLILKDETCINQVHLVFDSNLSRPNKITLSSKRMKEQQIGVPAELVKDYVVSLWYKGKCVAQKEIKDNYLRLNIIDFNAVKSDKVTVTVMSTNGIPNVRIFEVRVYGLK